MIPSDLKKFIKKPIKINVKKQFIKSRLSSLLKKEIIEKLKSSKSDNSNNIEDEY